MARPSSILPTALTSACAISVVALSFLWVRSYRRGDVLTYLTAAGNGYSIRSVPGGIEFTRADNLRDRVASSDPLPDGWSIRHMTWGTSQTFRPKSTNVHLHDQYVVVHHHPQPPAHAFAGFGWEDATITYPLLGSLSPYSGVLPGLRPAIYRTRILLLPDAFIILILATWPALRFIRQRRRAQLIAAGHCLTCGYDLRATPNQCPECGRVPRRGAAPE
jgi:hypothetical protein